MVLALIVITVLVYRAVPGHSFLLFDDNRDLYENQWLNPQPQIGWFWTHQFTEVYRPMIYTVLGLLTYVGRLARPEHIPGATFSDLNPHVFHTFNLALHVVNAVLIFAILRLLLRRDWPAFAGALLFAVHPLQAETVAWTMGINDLLSTCFSLLAIGLFLLDAPVAAAPRGWRFALATLCYVGALFAKPSAGAVPLMAAIIAFSFHGRAAWPAVRWLGLWLLIAVAWIPITHHAMQATSQVAATPLWTRPLVSADAVAFYLYKLVWPASLGFDYGRTPQVVLHHGWLYYTWLLPAGLIALACWRLRQWPWLACGLAVFVVAVLPVSGLIQFVFQAWSTVADRYMYQAMLGPALTFAWWLATKSTDATKPSAATMFVCAALVVLGLARTAPQAATWRDNFTFYQHALQVNPASYVAHANLAEAYTKENDLGDNRALPLAINHLRDALRIRPQDEQLYINLGAKLIRQGQFDEAAQLQRAALRLKPGHPDALHNLSLALIGQGNQYGRARQPEKARECFAAALTASPRSAQAQFLIGITYAQERRWSEAALHLRAALEIDPGHAPAQTTLDDVKRHLAGGKATHE